MESRERECGEWRAVHRRSWVVFRRSHRLPERQPARHSIDLNPRINPRAHRIGGNKVFAGNFYDQTSGSRFSYGEEGMKTFFFKNFPEGCSVEDLRDKFQRIDDVCDVFCPKKRDREGKLFGFVRFPIGCNEEELLEKINNIWLGSYKLRAFVARFSRFPAEKNTRVTQTFAAGWGLRKENKSFIDTLKGSGGSNCAGPLTHDICHFSSDTLIQNKEENVESNEIFSFQTKEEDRKWLEDCYSGYLKSKFSWDSHGEELLQESSGILNIKPMGGNLVLLKSVGDKKTEDVLFEFDEWSYFWFEWIRPWKDIDVNTNRVIWTNWFGVPVHAWTTSFFSFMCVQFGRFVNVDDSTESKERLDVARVMVSSNSLNQINKAFKVRIDGKVFSIRVVEEAICSCKNSNDEDDEDGSDADSHWDSDGEISAEPAAATVKGGDRSHLSGDGKILTIRKSDGSSSRRLNQKNKAAAGSTRKNVQSLISRENVARSVPSPRNKSKHCGTK